MKLLLVLLGWVFSIALVLGPYVAVLYAFPDIHPGFHPTYWLVMATYLMAATVLSPTPDRENMGLFGGLIDNPLSFEDDANRNLMLWALLLLPGKLVIATLVATWRLAFGGDGDGA